MSAEISGSLGIVETFSLVRKGRLRKIAKIQRVSFSGPKSRLLFQGAALRIGEFAVQSPIFSESYGEMPNKLSLGFWSRFVATFDFPVRKVYLRKAANFGRPGRLKREPHGPTSTAGARHAVARASCRVAGGRATGSPQWRPLMLPHSPLGVGR